MKATPERGAFAKALCINYRFNNAALCQGTT